MQAEFVLSRWNKEEEPVVQLKIDASVGVIEQVFQQGFSSTMSQLNQQVFGRS
jgi:PTH1 family peptidyl-tRNA hydrolase